MIRILHVVDLPGSNHWLNGVADHYDRDRFLHLAASLGPRNGLHEALEQRCVRTFALEAPKRWQFPLAVARLARIIVAERVDIVQTHLFGPTSVGLAAALLTGRRTIVTRHHADFTTTFNKPIHRQIDRAHALLAERVWSPSHFIADCMRRHEQVPLDRITVLPHAFDFELMKPSLSPEARRRLRASVGGDERFLIGCVGRLSIEKGVEVLLRAVPAVVAMHPQALFVLIGSGPQQAALEQLAESLGILAHVRFLGWRWDAWQLIEAMDVIAHPSPKEGFGIVYVESMAVEKAVVATRAGATVEILDDGETGILVPPGEPAALARGLIEIIGDPARAQAMGREARRRVIERFAFPRMMPVYERFYDAPRPT